MQVGDILEYRCPKFGIVWQWRVHSVLLGGARQEGLIEVSPVMAQPGCGSLNGGPIKEQPRVLVPEPMTRALRVVPLCEHAPTKEHHTG